MRLAGVAAIVLLALALVGAALVLMGDGATPGGTISMAQGLAVPEAAKFAPPDAPSLTAQDDSAEGAERLHWLSRQVRAGLSGPQPAAVPNHADVVVEGGDYVALNLLPVEYSELEEARRTSLDSTSYIWWGPENGTAMRVDDPVALASWLGGNAARIGAREDGFTSYTYGSTENTRCVLASDEWFVELRPITDSERSECAVALDRLRARFAGRSSSLASDEGFRTSLEGAARAPVWTWVRGGSIAALLGYTASYPVVQETLGAVLGDGDVLAEMSAGGDTGFRLRLVGPASSEAAASMPASVTREALIEASRDSALAVVTGGFDVPIARIAAVAGAENPYLAAYIADFQTVLTGGFESSIGALGLSAVLNPADVLSAAAALSRLSESEGLGEFGAQLGFVRRGDSFEVSLGAAQPVGGRSGLTAEMADAAGMPEHVSAAAYADVRSLAQRYGPLEPYREGGDRHWLDALDEVLVWIAPNDAGANEVHLYATLQPEANAP